jgi:hypothetical protein
MKYRFFTRKTDTFDYQLERSCLTCTTTFSGRYCPRCGEKVVEPDDRSFKHFIGGLVNAFTFIDGKFANSLRQLLFHPGQLSADIARGVRQPYMKPVAFFFVANFIYFLFPLFQTFNTTLHTQMNYLGYNEYATEKVNAILTETQSDLSQFDVVYNQASTSWSKLLLILLVILFFPFAAIVNFTRRNYLSDHLIFSLEFCTYVLFVPTILLGFAVLAIVGIGMLFGADWEFLFWDQYLRPVLVILLLYFFIRALRTFYQFPWWRVIVNSILLLFAIQLTLAAYRFILFEVTVRELTPH